MVVVFVVLMGMGRRGEHQSKTSDGEHAENKVLSG
tara:strand:- start:13832 stop:13936 length:105 start_codon:yes stop_codon:yes gene_type:complete